MLEFTRIVGLIIVARRLRRTMRHPQTIRLEVHHFHHFPPGPGEQQPVEQLPSTDNVVPLRPKRAA